MVAIDYFIAGLGVAALCVFAADFLLTTIGATFHTVLSNRVAGASWRFLTICLPDRTWARVSIGPMVMTAVAAFWIIGTSIAWAMVFQFESEAVVRTADGAPASWWMDYAYIGHLLSTLGGSLGKPGDVGWSLMAVLVAVNGMIILTLSVSFVLNTTQTVAQGRAFLATAELLDAEETFKAGTLSQLSGLVSNLNSVPLALYYSAPSRKRRLPLGLVRLFKVHLERGDQDGVQALRVVFADLPRFQPDEDIDDDEYRRRLESWAEQFEF